MKESFEYLVLSGGIISILIAAFHFAFWFLFKWKESLAPLSQLNNNIMLLLNYCLAAFFLLAGIILIIYRQEMISTRIGHAFLFLMGSVLAVRLILEFALPGSSLLMEGFLLILIAMFYIPLILS